MLRKERNSWWNKRAAASASDRHCSDAATAANRTESEQNRTCNESVDAAIRSDPVLTVHSTVLRICVPNVTRLRIQPDELPASSLSRLQLSALRCSLPAARSLPLVTAAS